MDENEKEATLRRASERLYGDSRLREGLTDEQAERLLAWGFRQVEREVAQAQTGPEAETTETIEAQVDAVRNTLRLVNQMVEQLPQATEARSREYVTQLVDALCEVDARTVQINDMLALEKLVDQRESLASSEIFRQVLEIMNMPPSEAGGTEDAQAREEERIVEDDSPAKTYALVATTKAIIDSTGALPEEEE